MAKRRAGLKGEKRNTAFWALKRNIVLSRATTMNTCSIMSNKRTSQYCSPNAVNAGANTHISIIKFIYRLLYVHKLKRLAHIIFSAIFIGWCVIEQNK